MSSEGVFNRLLDERTPELPLNVPIQTFSDGRVRNFLSSAPQEKGLRDELAKVDNQAGADKGRRGGTGHTATMTHPFPLHITRILTSTLLHVLVDLSKVSEDGGNRTDTHTHTHLSIPLVDNLVDNLYTSSPHLIYLHSYTLSYAPSHTPFQYTHSSTHSHTAHTPFHNRSTRDTITYPRSLSCIHTKTSLQPPLS